VTSPHLFNRDILMGQHSNAVPGEGFYITVPLIDVIVFWSEKINRLFHENRCKLTKAKRFHYDLFLINLSFLFHYF